MTPNRMSPELRAEAQLVFSLNFFSKMPLSADITYTKGETTLEELVQRYQAARAANPDPWSNPETGLALDHLARAVKRDPRLAELRLMNRTITYDTEGMRARTFMNRAGDRAYFIFAGTNRGQWLDNGIAMSGLPKTNLYQKYGENGEIIESYTVVEQGSQGQAEALDYFHKMAARLQLDESIDITVSGHSKGGNLAQFIALHEPLVDRCFSIDGQGFSPEHVAELRAQYPDYEQRVKKLIELSAQDDYVNVLGVKVIPEGQRYYFKRLYAPQNVNEERSFRDVVEALLRQHRLTAICDESGILSEEAGPGCTPTVIKEHSKHFMTVSLEERSSLIVGMMAFISDLMGYGQDNIYTEKSEQMVPREQIAVLNLPTIKAIFEPETLPKPLSEFSAEELTQASTEFVRRLPENWYREPINFGGAILTMGAVLVAVEGAVRVQAEPPVHRFLALTFRTLVAMVSQAAIEHQEVMEYTDYCVNLFRRMTGEGGGPAVCTE